MSRANQNPQRPLSQALIVNSRTRFGHSVHNIPVLRKTKNAKNERNYCYGPVDESYGGSVIAKMVSVRSFDTIIIREDRALSFILSFRGARIRFRFRG
jgi:hypothetical protein